MLQRYETELAEVRELVAQEDGEMAAVAREEEARLTSALAELEERIKPALVPHDPLDDCCGCTPDSPSDVVGKWR